MWTYILETPNSYLVFQNIGNSSPKFPCYNVTSKEQAHHLATQLNYLQTLEEVANEIKDEWDARHTGYLDGLADTIDDLKEVLKVHLQE